jgi:hypothetical protein
MKGKFGGHGPSKPDSEERGPTMEELMARAKVQMLPGPGRFQFDKELPIPEDKIREYFELSDAAEMPGKRNVGRLDLWAWIAETFPDEDFTVGSWTNNLDIFNPRVMRQAM